jgi:hypothetical protein
VKSCAALLLVAGLMLASRPVLAAPRVGCEGDGVWCGPVVGAALAPERTRYFSVALGVERWASQFSGSNNLAVLATTLRVSAFAPSVQLMMKPGTGTADYEDTRLLFGPALRAYFPVLGRQLSYGVGLLGELRFEEHFWLLYATPVEVSGVLYRKHGLEVELFVGLRRAFTGKLINSFLLDPNGFENEDAAANLHDATRENAWHGFIRLMVSRRVY